MTASTHARRTGKLRLRRGGGGQRRPPRPRQRVFDRLQARSFVLSLTAGGPSHLSTLLAISARHSRHGIFNGPDCSSSHLAAHHSIQILNAVLDRGVSLVRRCRGVPGGAGEARRQRMDRAGITSSMRQAI